MFKTRKELKQKINEAESRALMHFKKLFQIEQILKASDESKELYVTTINKIRRVLK